MRVPVIDANGTPLMPCTPAKARHLLKQGTATAFWNKLGIFCVRLTYGVDQPDQQPLVVGIDPGATYEGFRVVGTQDTVVNLMVEAPTHVGRAVQQRRQMRRGRRYRKCRRRPARFNNRTRPAGWVPPSTRSRWEAKARIVAQLQQVLPLTDAVVEDVQAETRPGKRRGGKPRHWNAAFSPVQHGKQHLYRLLRGMGLTLHLRQGYETKALREQYGVKKSRGKKQRTFASHAVDAWVLAAHVSGAGHPTDTRIWYVVPVRVHRRQLHRLEPSKGGVRQPYGGTQSLGFKRGTLVRHPKYGLCGVGGFDRTRQTISLHAYRTNKRLTQGARPEHCQRLTTVAFRSWLVRRKEDGGASSTR